MTCSECIEVLLEGDLTEDLDTHIRECERCTLAVQLLRDAQDSLSQDLRQQSVGLRPAQTLAEYAYRRVRRERLLWRIVLPVLLILIAATGMLITRTFGPELKRLTEPPPAVETSTFSLRCLSPEQAASLLRPYLPSPRNPMWQAERFDVRPAAAGMQAVTVRAPHATLVQVPELLARFEQDPTAACRKDGAKP